uniref:Chromodomain helicase DNA binding protein 7 n=1 Tax=Cynoglossus semilaevis TaxID=244447 RepID=A0A3P8WMV5_CYNSE
MQELEKDKRVHQKIKRYKAKQQLNSFITEMDDEPFNPDYVEVDRVLDISESTDENGELVTLYLVKWCSLPYEESTWELKADIDQSKIEEYEHIAARTPNTKRVDRPPTADWKKLEGSRDYRNGNTLREYQLEGLNWLTFNWYNSRNCILADEMGLGKTIQSITFLYEMYMTGIEGPFLVIAPLSTIPNWEREFRTWTELNAVVYHGSQASRKTIQAYEMHYRDAQGKIIKGAYRFHAVITTFEMILADCPELRSIPCWGRWGDILAHGRFKRPLKEADVETICRALLAYCLLHYRGDENIKSFIWDLITPSADGTTKTLTNHSGLSTPVPRGRKGKKGKTPAQPLQSPRADWLVTCNPDHLLQEDSYKRHLKHHCNKVLLRVRMLYYLRQEVVGNQAEPACFFCSELDIWIPQPFQAEVPADWWDSEADKSLLIGVFKHGYEKYNSMRADPTLCFLERVGMPDAKAIAAEQRGSDMMADGVDG